jgi:uncharacterized protein (DUF2336 family)
MAFDTLGAGPNRRPPEKRRGALAHEIQTAIRSGSKQERADVLLRLVDRVVMGSSRLDPYQLAAFDDAVCRLISRVEPSTRAEVAARLAHFDSPLTSTLNWLARDCIGSARPVLMGKNSLSEAELGNVALVKGDQHLFALAARGHVSERVADVIVDRAGITVLRRLASNKGAKLSKTGISKIVTKAGMDEELAGIVGLRADLPADILENLLWETTDQVRNRLVAQAPVQLRELIEQTLARIYRDLEISDEDLKSLRAIEQQMRAQGTPDEPAIVAFAVSRQMLELTAAISIRSSAQLDLTSRILLGPRTDLVLISCRCAGLSWSTIEPILVNRRGERPSSRQGIDAARDDFEGLQLETAQRTLQAMAALKPAA